MKFRYYPCRLSALALLATGSAACAQATFTWRNDAGDGLWSNATNWDLSSAPSGSEIIRFDNDVQTAMTNDATTSMRHQIWFDSGVTVARAVGGTIENEFVAVSGVMPLIRNNSTAGHSINFPIWIGSDGLSLAANSGNLTLGGVISGTGSISKSGDATLTLNRVNSFEGRTSVNGGILSITTDSNLGTAPASLVADQLSINGGTLKAGSSAFTLNANRGITLGVLGATLDTAAAGTGNQVTIASPITGNGPLVIKAAGNMGAGGGGRTTLSNTANDFTGGITVESGLVEWGSDASFGNTANTITLKSGGGLLTTSAGKSLPGTRSIVLDAGAGTAYVRLWSSASLTIDSGIVGTGHLSHVDGGTLTLAGANSFTGNMKNEAGTMVLSGTNSYTGYTFVTGSSTLSLGADEVLPDATDVLFYGGTKLNLNGKSETVGGLMVGSGSDTNVTIDLGASGSTGTLTVTDNTMPSGAPTNAGGSFYAKISGYGNIIYSHGSQIASNAHWDWLNTANDFSGNITIAKGRLRTALGAGGVGAFGNAENDLVFDGEIVSTLGNQQGTASLQAAAGGALNLAATRDIILNTGKEGTFYVWSGNTYTINGKVTGGGNLRKEDGGVLLLANTANTWGGDTTIVQGELRLGATGAYSAASAANGTLIIGTSDGASPTLNLNGTDLTVSRLSGGGYSNGIVTGVNSTLTVNGTGNLEYSGRVTNNGGTNQGTTVRYTGGASLTLSGTGDNSGGRAAVDAGTLVLAKASTASVHAVGTNNFPALTINGGTAKLGGSGDDQIYTMSNVHMNGGSFDLNGMSEGFRGLTGAEGGVTNTGETTSYLNLGESSMVSDRYVFEGSISDGTAQVSLTKTGEGIQELRGTSTYTGNTSVEGGILMVDGTLGSTTMTVSNAGMGGNGSTGGGISLLSGGGLVASIGDWTGSPGVGFSDLGAFYLDITSGDPHAVLVDTTGLANFSEVDTVFPILFTTTGITGFNAADWTVAAPGFPGHGTWAVQQNGNSIELVYTASTDPYNDWASAKGLTAGNNGKGMDPDGDGMTNLQEFAFDGNPLNPDTDGKIRAGLGDPDGEGGDDRALVLTCPVRNGAAFSGPGDIEATIDNLIYRVQGSTDLADFVTMEITEISPALADGMPVLSAGWTYRTFRTPGSVPGPISRAFIRTAVEEVPTP